MTDQVKSSIAEDEADQSNAGSDSLPPELLKDILPLIDSLAVLRLKTQATHQLKTIIGTYPSPVKVIEEICVRAKALENIYAQEACIELVAAVIAETPGPIEPTLSKQRIVQTLQELGKTEKRLAFAAQKALEKIENLWNAEKQTQAKQDTWRHTEPVSQSPAPLIHPDLPSSSPEVSQVAFGFLPLPIHDQLLSFHGSTRPSDLIHSLESSFQSTDLRSLKSHYPALIPFLVDILVDKNVRTKLCVLNMLQAVLSIQGISLTVDLIPQAERLCPKLGDVNIGVRQAVFKCLRVILREIRLGKLLDTFALSLKSDNWHQREETLKLLIVATLAVDEAHNIDFLELVPLVAPLMDDETPKVRYVAVETFCSLAYICGSERVEQELQPLMDEVALSLLKARFARKTVPVVREDTVEFHRETPLSAPVSTKNLHSVVSGPKTPNTFFDFNNRQETQTLLPSHSASVLPTSRSHNTLPKIKDTVEKVREVRVVVDSSPIRIRRSGRFRATLDSISPRKPDELTSTFPRNSSLPSLRKETNALKSLSASTSYLKPEDLQAPMNTSADLSSIMRGLQAIEWAEQFETLNLMRKLLKFSPEVFKSSNFQEILRQVVIWAESLRSSLSKNALMVLGEMCEFLPRSLEADVEQLLSLLLRKSVDTNMFISEVAGKALEQMCQHLSDGRLVTCLLNNIAGIRSSLVKAKTANCFEMLIERLKGQFPKIRDFARVVKTLFDYTQDASAEVRSSAKRAFHRLSQVTSQEDIDRYMSRVLPSRSFEQYRETQQTWSAPEEPRVKHNSARELGRREGKVRRLVLRSSRVTETTQSTGDTMQEVVTALKGPVWKERYDAISRASSTALQAAESGQGANLSQAIECICTGVTDSSLKVSYHSVSCLKKLIGPLQDALSQHITALVLALGQALSTSNSSLKSLSIEVLAHIIGHSEVSQSLPSLVNAFSQVTGRGKVGLLKLITEVLPSSPSRELILRHAVPVAKALLSDWRPELNSESVEFLTRLETLIELKEVLSEEQMQQLAGHLN